MGAPAADAAAWPAATKLLSTARARLCALMRMNQKKEIRIRFWSSETKIGTGSSRSMIHQMSAHVIEIAARRMNRFCAMGRIAA
jgi:hypothetical protein